MASSLRAAARLRPLTAPLTPLQKRCVASVTAKQSQTWGEHPVFSNEACGPSIKTAIPGPQTQKAIAELDKVFDTRSLNMMANYQLSYGNYIVDPDENVLLDVCVHFARHYLD